MKLVNSDIKIHPLADVQTKHIGEGATIKQRPEKFLETIIEDNASVGANSSIIGGISIGAYTMIGAGSVVTKRSGVFSSLW